MSLLELPENQEIMGKVDVMQFIVTKADMLGEGEERLQKAKDLLQSEYKGSVEKLKYLCRYTNIDISTNYSPLVFAFSLGHIYLGNIFDYDSTDSVKIIDFIRQNISTPSMPHSSLWERIKRYLN